MPFILTWNLSSSPFITAYMIVHTFSILFTISSVQFSLVFQLCLTLYDPMNRSTPSLPVYHQLPESTQTHVHRVDDAIQPSHPLLSPSPPALNLPWHQGLFQWVFQFSSVAQSCPFATPWIAAHQASLSTTNSWSLPKLLSIESVMASSQFLP